MDMPNAQGPNVEHLESQKQSRDVIDLPMLVMEYIFAHFSYFEVLQFRLISRYWDEAIRGKCYFTLWVSHSIYPFYIWTTVAYVAKADDVFLHNLTNHNLQWVAVKEQIEDFTQSHENIASSSKKVKTRCIPKMSPRYHHSSVYVNESMYVFGGCISPSTAYNDLWRFDMNSKKWNRIIAAGTLPLPRLFCSFTYYECYEALLTDQPKQYIVLFGGFLFDEKLDVKDRLLSTIHLFDIAHNRWSLISTEGQIQLKSGNHSAVIIGDELVVFNGLRMVDQQEVDCNEVYVFDLKKRIWSQQKTSITSHCPFVRTTMESYRNQSFLRRKTVQTPFALDPHNILYICGCNTNVLFIAAFLLTRKSCTDQSCYLCQGKSSSQQQMSTQKESDWEWMQVDISIVGLDFEFTYGAEFCKVSFSLSCTQEANLNLYILDWRYVGIFDCERRGYSSEDSYDIGIIG